MVTEQCYPSHEREKKWTPITTATTEKVQLTSFLCFADNTNIYTTLFCLWKSAHCVESVLLYVCIYIHPKNYLTVDVQKTYEIIGRQTLVWNICESNDLSTIYKCLLFQWKLLLNRSKICRPFISYVNCQIILWVHGLKFVQQLLGLNYILQSISNHIRRMDPRHMLFLLSTLWFHYKKTNRWSCSMG